MNDRARKVPAGGTARRLIQPGRVEQLMEYLEDVERMRREAQEWEDLGIERILEEI